MYSRERPQANGPVLGRRQKISVLADGQNWLLVARDLEVQAEDRHGSAPTPDPGAYGGYPCRPYPLPLAQEPSGSFHRLRNLARGGIVNGSLFSLTPDRYRRRADLF